MACRGSSAHSDCVWWQGKKTQLTIPTQSAGDEVVSRVVGLARALCIDIIVRQVFDTAEKATAIAVKWISEKIQTKRRKRRRSHVTLPQVSLAHLFPHNSHIPKPPKCSHTSRTHVQHSHTCHTRTYHPSTHHLLKHLSLTHISLTHSLPHNSHTHQNCTHRTHAYNTHTHVTYSHITRTPTTHSPISPHHPIHPPLCMCVRCDCGCMGMCMCMYVHVYVH